MEPSLLERLISVYTVLAGWVLTGLLIGKVFPLVVDWLEKKSGKFIAGAINKYRHYLSMPVLVPLLGKFLFWVGVPLLIFTSLRGRTLTFNELVAPVTAWTAILVGAAFAWIWIDLGVNDERLRGFPNDATAGDRAERESNWSSPTQGSFLLAMMVGNTGFMGYPVILSTVGEKFFIYAVLYDLLGSTLGSYGLGVALASYYGKPKEGEEKKVWYINLLQALGRNPALWSLIISLAIAGVAFPDGVDATLKTIAVPIVPLSLVMIGLQLSLLPALSRLSQAITCLLIKMLFTPLVVGTVLMFLGIEGRERQAMVLQMGMPPAFATLVIAQAYNLDRNLSVTTLALGSVMLIFTLPVWLWLFA